METDTMTTPEVAKLLKVNEKRVSQLMRLGRLHSLGRAQKRGMPHLFATSEVEALASTPRPRGRPLTPRREPIKYFSGTLDAGLLTLQEVADTLGVQYPRVAALVKAGRIRAFRIGQSRDMFVTKDELARVQEERAERKRA